MKPNTGSYTSISKALVFPIVFIATFALGNVFSFGLVEDLGADFDSLGCISEGRADDIGVDFDSIGVIGCPIGDDDDTLGLDDDDLAVHCEKVEVDIGSLRVKQYTHPKIPSGQAISVNVIINASACPSSLDLELFFNRKPPSPWFYRFECDDPVVNGTCGAPGKTIRIDNIQDDKRLTLQMAIPTYAAPGAYNLRLSTRRVK